MTFEGYVADHGNELIRLAYVLTGDSHRAEDLAQTVLASAYARWSKISQTASPHAYIRTMMVNANLDWHRRRSSTERPLAPDAVDHISARQPAPDVADEVTDRDQLRALVDQLSPRARTVLVLRYYADLSDHSIAEAIGIAPSTVRAIASRALSSLRQTAQKESL